MGVRVILHLYICTCALYYTIIYYAIHYYLFFYFLLQKAYLLTLGESEIYNYILKVSVNFWCCWLMYCLIRERNFHPNMQKCTWKYTCTIFPS